MSEKAEPAFVEKTLTAENTWTDELQVDAEELVSISAIGNSFTGTTVLQRKLPGQTTFQSVANPDGSVGWTSKDIQATYQADERCSLRLGVPTGGFAGTSVACRLGKG